MEQRQVATIHQGMAAFDGPPHAVAKVLAGMPPVFLYALRTDEHRRDFPLARATEGANQSAKDHIQPWTTWIGQDPVANRPRRLEARKSRQRVQPGLERAGT